VLVSPHFRTIQTAIGLLEKHPQKAEFTLRVDPFIKEVLRNSCDIPSSVEDLKSFTTRMTQETGFKFDLSHELLVDDLWSVKIMTNKEYRDRLMERLDSGKSLYEAVIGHQ